MVATDSKWIWTLLPDFMFHADNTTCTCASFTPNVIIGMHHADKKQEK